MFLPSKWIIILQVYFYPTPGWFTKGDNCTKWDKIVQFLSADSEVTADAANINQLNPYIIIKQRVQFCFKRLCEFWGLVVLVVQFGQLMHHLKALGLLIFIISVLDHSILPSLVTFWRHDVLNIHTLWLLMDFEPIIYPVNRDFLFDSVNLIAELLRVSVHIWEYLIWWMHAKSTWHYEVS